MTGRGFSTTRTILKWAVALAIGTLFALVPASAGVRPVQFPGFYDNASGSPLLQLIHSTRSTLDLEIYEMDDVKVLNAIRMALKRGVRVRVVKEPAPIGASCRIFDRTPSRTPDPNCENQKQLAREIVASGGSYVAFNKMVFCGTSGATQCVQHGKLAIFDGRLALISTGNFNASSLCDLAQRPDACNRDYSVVQSDPEVIDALAQVFEADLRARPMDLRKILNPSVARKLTVSPISLDILISFISSARNSIRIQNQYLKDPNLNQALINAARRGVKVEVTVSSPCAFGPPSAGDTRTVTQIFSAFDAAGISSRIFTRAISVKGRPGYMHAKAIVIDDVWAWVGSVNGSTQALTRNREFGFFLNDGNDVRALASIMSSDQRNPGSESWQESLRCLKDR